jgi:hypothetical protein
MLGKGRKMSRNSEGKAGTQESSLTEPFIEDVSTRSVATPSKEETIL